MEGIRGSRGDEESHDVRELRMMADTVREALIDASGMSHDLELVRLVGTRQIADTLQRLEPSAEQSVWDMQPVMQFDPEDPGPALTEASRARGIGTELVTRPTTLLANPLLPSMYPDCPGRARVPARPGRRRGAGCWSRDGTRRTGSRPRG